MSFRVLAVGAGSAVASGYAVQAGIIAVLAVLVPLSLYLAHRFLGDLVPVLIMLGTPVFVIFILPHAPGSPVAFLRDPHAHSAQDHVTWLVGLAFLLPVALAVAYKTRRGDQRGVTGTRPVFRRRPK